MSHFRCIRSPWPVLVALLASAARADEPRVFPVDSNLRAAAFKVAIDPPVGVKADGHIRMTDGSRDKLHAAVLLLDDGRTKAAIVTLDLLASPDDMVALLRAAVGGATGIATENILVANSHNHSGPKWDREAPWAKKLIAEVADAAGKAGKEYRQVSVGYGVDRIDFSINRRKVINGRAVVRLNPEGPNDPRVKVLRFDDGRSWDPVAVLMHAACHPCVFTWGDKWSTPHPEGYPKMSADFPGEAKRFVEGVYGRGTTALFLQGCCGDIRPNLPGHPYRCGDEADIRWTGRNLGTAVVRAADRSAIREELAKRPTIYPIKCASKMITLPARVVVDGATEVKCEIQAIKVGPFVFLTLPGEPMVEYGLAIEKAVADRAIPIVVGYANGNIHYICTAESFQVGGYEPNTSKTGPGAEAIIHAEVQGLVDRVVGDVFDSFAPVVPKGYTPQIPDASKKRR